MTNLKTTKRALVSSLIALFICFTMLLGTTFAWFTDSVKSSGNIIQTGKLDVAMYWAKGAEDPNAEETEWMDASEGAIFTNDKWEPGYSDAKHVKIANEGNLALNYRLRITADGVVGKLADVIDVYYFAEAKALTRADVENATPVGTLTEVLGTTKNLSKTAYGSLETTEVAIHTLVLVMNTSAGDEYQEASLGCNFSVELIATQKSSESDSFGTDYDADVPNAEVPAALVRELDDLTFDTSNTKFGANLAALGVTELDVGYQFEPTQSAEDGENSAYEYWKADFFVYADRKVPADSMALAGYYQAWCSLNNDNWVALVNEGTDIEAGEENAIRLIEAMGVPVHYKDLCEYGNDGIGFRCGAVDITGANAGTTLTVELRLYEPTKNEAGAEETGNYITIGKFEYTFPATEVNSQEDFNAAVAVGGTVKLGVGEYKMPNTINAVEMTIIGTTSNARTTISNTTIDVTKGAYLDNAKLTFINCTIKTSTDYVYDANGNKGSDYAALYSPNVTYENCTFSGPMRVGRDGARFIDCTFNDLGNDYVWTYGNDCTFEGCTFNSEGKAILIYKDPAQKESTVTVKNCIFNATTGAKAGAIANQNCAAIEIDNTGCSVNLTLEGNTYNHEYFSGEWRIKTYQTERTNKVVVNGTEYTTIALDGKTMTIDASKNVTVNG